jgi:predicted nuclease of predicted toxin-antitoxin system
MKILIDMNLPPILVNLLATRGIESKHWYGIGAMDASDSEIMEYAINNNYIVLTYDLDFSAILSVTHGKKPSVIQIRSQLLQPEQLADIIAVSLAQCENELNAGAIMSIDIRRARLRILPL